MKVLFEAIDIRHGQITTIHDPTNTNVVIDAPHKDLRRARSAMLSLAPTTTGSATAIALIYPELKGELNGHAVRAPVLNASLTDCVFEMVRPVTVPEISEIRGVDSSGVIATLLDRKLVTTSGRKDVIGRPILYKTTKEFLLRFGLKDVSELPSLKELEEIRRLSMSDPEPEPAPAAQPTAEPAPDTPADGEE